MSPRTLIHARLGRVVVARGTLSCRESARPAKDSQKLVVIGFDGLDPDLVRQWAGGGRLPTFARLTEHGSMAELDTTHSPESPTAWASFATGVNAGKHNIYDFLVRETSSSLIDLGMVERIPGRFPFNYIPVRRPQENVECRSRQLRPRGDGRHVDLELPARQGEVRHHGHRTHGPLVVTKALSSRHVALGIQPSAGDSVRRRWLKDAG